MTQNFCSQANLAQVLAFLKSGSAELVSGCETADRAGLHGRFLAALRRHAPEVGLTHAWPICSHPFVHASC